MRRRIADAVKRRRYERLLARMAGPKLIAAFGDAYPEAVFVEIGANDGEQHDHLRPMILSRGWRGVMVEPVPYVFARLRANYGAIERVALENAAIAGSDGTLPFFHLREADPDERAALPEWYDALGSFSRDAIAGHVTTIPDIEERIVEVEVPVITFDTLCARHALERVDLVLVDTEGYDAEILRSIDLERHRPRLIVFEHFHLSEADRDDLRTTLRGLGYGVLEEGFDTFALDLAPADELARRFGRMKAAVAPVTVRDEPARA